MMAACAQRDVSQGRAEIARAEARANADERSMCIDSSPWQALKSGKKLLLSSDHSSRIDKHKLQVHQFAGLLVP